MASENILNQLSQPFYKIVNGKYVANERLTEFCSKEVLKIIIDGNEFTGYKTYSFFWEKTYVKEPERSTSGVIGNLNSYATFITPHLQIKFSLMSVKDYRRLYDLILARNEYVVTCYDPLTNKTTTNKMYFYPDTLPKLNMLARSILNDGQKEKWVELLGVQDYTIEMVGTNSELGDVIVQYDINLPDGFSGAITSKTVNVAKRQQIIVGSGAEDIMSATLTSSKGEKYIFASWNTKKDGSGITYTKDSTLDIIDNTTLYAKWTDNDAYTLSYNYGLGEPKVDDYGNAIYSKEIKFGDYYGDLYESTTPSVEFDGQTIKDAYKRKGWYKTPQIGFTFDEKGNKVEVAPITSTTLYSVVGNSTIYQIFEPNEYTIRFNSNGGTTIDSIKNKFDTTVAIPIPKKDGYTFDGWYYDTAFTKRFGGSIPPKNATLYAKWE